jgi:hypothetical protein
LYDQIPNRRQYGFYKPQIIDSSGTDGSLPVHKVLTNENHAHVDFDLIVDDFIVASPGLHFVSKMMVATTIEAFVGDAHKDTKRQNLEVVRFILINLGLNNHPISMATSRDTLSSIFLYE